MIRREKGAERRILPETLDKSQLETIISFNADIITGEYYDSRRHESHRKLLSILLLLYGQGQ